MFKKSDVRGELVHLRDSYAATRKHTNYPPELARLLGEAISAAVLLSATIKFEGKLSLQLQGDGPLSLLLVQISHQQKFRAMLKWRERPTGLSFLETVGTARLAITIKPDKGEQYQGIVPLRQNTLSLCLEEYFTQSEQLQTRIWLCADTSMTAGFLLQKLPGRSDKEAERDWEHLTILSETITHKELLHLPNKELLFRLFHDEEVTLFEKQSVQFGCECSRERCESIITGMGKHELRAVINEREYLDITCDFCGAKYHFDVVDLRRLEREMD